MKILIPTDFSKLSDNAIYYTIDMVKKQKNVEFILYHSFIPFDTGLIYPKFIDLENKLVKEVLNKQMNSLVNRMKKETSNIKISSFVDEGVEYKGIARFSKLKKVDLIIMGTKGASGLNEALFGSRTWGVIKESKIPVICVPGKKKNFKTKKILLATDYKMNEVILKKIKNLCDIFNAKVYIVHFIYEGVYNLAKDIRFEKFKPTVNKILKNRIAGYSEIKGEDFLSDLNKYVIKNKIDMISTITYKREGLFNKLFDKSFTKKIACHTKIPLLAFHS